jgi:hypothetical protein
MKLCKIHETVNSRAFKNIPHPLSTFVDIHK